MRRANVQLHSDRRAEILAAAQRCFARSGFHQTSMQEICAEAGMSPGNLYRYFPSKEAIIAGIAERDRAEVGAQLAEAEFSTDFFGTLAAVARRYIVERPDEEIALCAEIMTESRRNPAVARIMRDFDAEVRAKLVSILRAAAARGDIAPQTDFEAVATMLVAMTDGIWWRRAVEPGLDAERLLPLFMDVVRHLLGCSATAGELPECTQ
jgi:AcrR family transcriptional regulator